MHFSTITTAATLLAMTPSALAVGSAKVVNNCAAPMYYASVAQNIHAEMAELPSTGYEEAYSLPDVGVSIKMSPKSSGKVTQFEYTWAGGNIYYDISNIDGYVFSEGGMSLVPSQAGAEGYPSCQPVVCPAGESTCTGAYNNPDDVRTMVCPDSTDLIFTLCPNSTTTDSATKREAEPHSHGHRIHARHILRK